MDKAKEYLSRAISSRLYQCAIMLFCIALVVLIFNRVRVYQIEQNLPPEGEIRVHFIDVGQGDSTLIQSRNANVLIDAGPPAAAGALAAYIEALGISTIDYVVATHPHSDHIGGMPAILDRFAVQNFWMPDVTHETASFERMLDAIERNGIAITTVETGARIDVDIIQMLVLSPAPGIVKNNLNDYSIVLHMTYGSTAFLFTGDAEAPVEARIAASHIPVRANILKAGHHGSRTSSTDIFLDAVAPQITVVSAGAGNQFGHPHRDVLERFESRNIKILRTDELGTIIISTNGETLFLY